MFQRDASPKSKEYFIGNISLEISLLTWDECKRAVALIQNRIPDASFAGSIARMDLPAGCLSQIEGIFYWNSPPYWDGSPCSYCISVCSLGRGIFMFLAPINIISDTKSGPTILYVSKNINILESNFYSSDTCESGTCKCGTSAECKGSLCISGVCEGRSFLNWRRNY